MRNPEWKNISNLTTTQLFHITFVNRAENLAAPFDKTLSRIKKHEEYESLELDNHTVIL